MGGTLTGYATGYYPATASGGRCSRPPSVVWTGGGKASLSDPGFLCDGVTPTFDLSTIPGDGAQQSTGAGGVATTCASNSPVSGQVTVTTHVAVAHGIAPGQTFPLTLFTPSALNTTYTALPSPTPTTLVGTAAIGSPAGTCPSLSGLVEGKALGGTGGTMTLTPISSTNPFGTGHDRNHDEERPEILWNYRRIRGGLAISPARNSRASSTTKATHCRARLRSSRG